MTFASRADVGFRSERGPVLIALMTTTSLVAIDATILATAVPTIVGDLGGFTSFPWLFSIYLLAQAVTVPVYSKIADTFGRKPVILVGIATFLTGSVLCGLAWSMPALIAFRAIQGLGAGAVQPMSVTIVGDIYTDRRAGPRAGVPRERLGCGVGGGAHPRWPVQPDRRLAVDLLRQRAPGADAPHGCWFAGTTRPLSTAPTGSTGWAVGSSPRA